MNNKGSLHSWIRHEFEMMVTLLKSVPTALTVLFVLVVIGMNFLSRFSFVSLPWLALNAGILISWLSFLFMDIVTKHYGARAANKLSILAIVANLTCCLICVIVSHLGNYPQLDMIFGGQWSILTASTIAYVISALTNNYTNIYIGGLFTKNPDGKVAYATRSFVSTFLSQVLDNFIFVFLAFVVLPMIPGALQVHWTVAQCLGCSVLAAFIEMLSEAIFSPIGYYTVKRWEKNGVGAEYIAKYC